MSSKGNCKKKKVTKDGTQVAEDRESQIIWNNFGRLIGR